MIRHNEGFEAASCTGKMRFASFNAATRQTKRWRNRQDGDRSGLKPYRCRVCHGYHVGRPSDQDRPKHEWKRYKARYEGAPQ